MKPIQRAVAVGMMALALALSGAPPISASDDDCHSKLWALPVESAALPDAWSIKEITPSPHGVWSMTLWRTDGAGPLSVSLQCVPAIDAYVEAALRALEINGTTRAAVASIGERTWAIRGVYQPDYDFVVSEVHRATGDILGEIWAGDAIVQQDDWDELQDIALAFDALLD